MKSLSRVSRLMPSSDSRLVLRGGDIYYRRRFDGIGAYKMSGLSRLLHWIGRLHLEDGQGGIAEQAGTTCHSQWHHAEQNQAVGTADTFPAPENAREQKTDNTDVRNWHANIEQHASAGVNKILLGNKCDWDEKRAVKIEDGRALADEFGLRFLETSAKANEGVEQAFYTIARYVQF